jgi:hypothetical protein
MSEEEWSSCSTITIDEQIQLCQLQALYIYLEEKSNGSLFDDVSSVYRVPLSESHIEKFQICVAQQREFFLVIILGVLRDFIIEYLTEVRYDTNESLKIFLENKFDNDEEYNLFNEFFPDIVNVGHAFSLFQFLSSLKA